MGSHTQKSVWSALQRLSRLGVVLKEQKGKEGHYSLNRNHLAAPYIIGLAKLKDEFLQRTADLLESWEKDRPFEHHNKESRNRVESKKVLTGDNNFPTGRRSEKFVVPAAAVKILLWVEIRDRVQPSRDRLPEVHHLTYLKHLYP